MDRLAADPAAGCRMGAAGAPKLTPFSASEVARQLETLYEGLVRRKRGDRP